MSKLKNNTAQLEALLAKVNALPEAGSGGSNFDTIIIISETGGCVNGIAISPDVATEVPVSLSSDVFPVLYSFPIYNVSITFTVARTGESYTLEAGPGKNPANGHFNVLGLRHLSFIPGDTILVSGTSDI